jgi:uncharacterized membrane protein
LNANPYAAPRADAPDTGNGITEEPPQPWEIGEVVKLAWDRIKANPVPLVGPYFIIGFFLFALGEAPNILILSHVVEQGSQEATIVTIVGFIVGQIIGAYFQVGLTRAWILAARGGTPTFGMPFIGFDRFLPVVASTFLLLLAVAVGMVLLIVPGIVLALGLQFASYYIVDANMGPIDALSASWRATRGQKGMLFAFGLVGGALAAAGLIACCVGAAVTVPLFYVAHAIIFTRISGRAPATAWTGGGGGSPPQWQGGPPIPPAYGPPPGSYGGPPGYGPT